MSDRPDHRELAAIVPFCGAEMVSSWGDVDGGTI
jgi:hypothetical protein